MGSGRGVVGGGKGGGDGRGGVGGGGGVGIRTVGLSGVFGVIILRRLDWGALKHGFGLGSNRGVVCGWPQWRTGQSGI